MPRDRVSRLLDEFSAVTSAAPRHVSPARRLTMRNRMPVATLFGATVVIAAVAVAALVIGRPGPSSIVGASPSAPPVTTPPSSVAAVASPSAVAVASPTRTATPAPSAHPTTGPCDPASLAARITGWEGAAGSRIATVELTNTGTGSCLLDAVDRPQLVGGDGTVLIDGKAPASSDQLTIAPGDVLTTLVSASNDCKPAPVPPVSVAFVFADGQRLVAAPASPTDATVPPCNGAGTPAAIDMHPWAR
jgi:Protein of unknown function (DUF4232)